MKEGKNDKNRSKQIDQVTLLGCGIDVLLIVVKLVSGVLGHSAAMIADAVHSLSDFLTDIVVFVFIRLGNKPQDKTHDFGHGKYETLASALIGMILIGVGIAILVEGAKKIWDVAHGAVLPSPGWVAFVAAVVSILSKEWCYHVTVHVGRRVGSEAVIANAWHHRSDALSSVGTALGIGGAIALGSRWTVLDPIAAVIVGVLIVVTSVGLLRTAVNELLERSLPDDMEREIIQITEDEPDVSSVHHLRTRRIGNNIAIDMHLRMPGDITLYEAHEHETNIEHRLRLRFGNHTLISLHAEPLKVDGKYVEPVQ